MVGEVLSFGGVVPWLWRYAQTITWDTFAYKPNGVCLFPEGRKVETVETWKGET
jgi:hypothetical protein